MTRYTIIYPDNSRGHVNASTKEHMLLAGDLEQIDERLFRITWKPLTLSSFAELIKVMPRMDLATFVRFYPGLFVWLINEVRRKELLESAEGMALRLKECA
jgi:hypothetical protein